MSSIFRSRSFYLGSAVGLAGSLYYNQRMNKLDSNSLIERLTNTKRLAGMDWKPPSRFELINRLKGLDGNGEWKDEENAVFDLLIIGGGATGTGCALDGASRGLKVACVERGDFSCGNKRTLDNRPAYDAFLRCIIETSSKSTKLVHGGVRYLEKAFRNLDWEQYKLVREALTERSTFLKIAPHLAEQLPIMLPIYK